MTAEMAPIPKTNIELAEKFHNSLFRALQEALSDTEAVLDLVSRTETHAPAFRETRFCKGCVLPVVDSVATSFLTDEFGLNSQQIRQSLRCEGVTTLTIGTLIASSSLVSTADEVVACFGKPEFLIVVESRAMKAPKRSMLRAVDAVLRENPEVGTYNQTI